MAEAMKSVVATVLKGIDRYNPENLPTLEKYLEIQAVDNAYDLEANLAILKLYQFNPPNYKLPVVQLILLKALTNLPHTDFILCQCLLDQQNLANDEIQKIVALHKLLEACQFADFWFAIQNPDEADLTVGIEGFEDSIRKFICHVVNITYQNIEKDTLISFLGGITDDELDMWMNKYGWKNTEDLIFISNQEDNIKTKNITEKIDFESVAAIMSLTR